jgi:hypothetical protein
MRTVNYVYNSRLATWWRAVESIDSSRRRRTISTRSELAVTAFICYSHADTKHLERLHKNMAQLLRETSSRHGPTTRLCRGYSSVGASHNKRTGFDTGFVFLNANGWDIHPDADHELMAVAFIIELVEHPRTTGE